MQTIAVVLDVTLSLALLNVWLLRFDRSTAYRGGDAGSMREEFVVYGLPEWLMYVVGTFKVGAALSLLLGLWFQTLVFPAALVISVLMVGALIMHFRVRDPLKKSLPAFLLFAVSVALCFVSIHR